MLIPNKKYDNVELINHARLPKSYVIKARFAEFEFSKHTHEEYAIGVVEKGIKNLTINGETHTMTAGDIFTINPETFHAGGTIDSINVNYSVIFLPSDMITKIINNELVSGDIYFKNPVNRHKILSGSLLNLIESYTVGSYDLSFESNLVETLTTAFYTFGEKCIERELTLPEKRVNLVCDYMKENCLNEITLDNLAELAGLSKYYFIREFKKHKNVSPHKYLLAERLKEAKKMLKAGNNIADTVYRCRFSDQSHFTRTFKSSFAMTPANFQNFFS